MTYQPKVSIVVGVRNMRQYIERTIDSLVQCKYPNKEIIIVDDGSDDGTGELIESRRAAATEQLKCIHLGRSGIAKARDAGFRESTGDIVAYTDADCAVAIDWVERFLPHFADQGVGAVTGRTIFLHSENADLPSLCRSVDFELRYGRLGKDVNEATGPNCAFRRSALQRIGGFDVKAEFGEDTVTSYKLVESGMKIVYEKDMVVYHVPEEGAWKYFRKRYRDAKNHVLVSLRFPRQAVNDRFIGLKFIVEPILSALMIVQLPILILVLLLRFDAVASFVGLDLVALAILSIVLNFDEAARVAAVAKSRFAFLEASVFLFARSLVLGAGLIVGVLAAAT